MHSVILNWQESSPNDPVSSYNVYRSATPTGPFTKINTSPITGLTFTDTNVKSGDTWSYEATAVDANNVESDPSNVVTAKVPGPNAPTGLTAITS